VSSTGKTGVQSLMIETFIEFVEIDFSVEKFMKRSGAALKNKETGNYSLLGPVKCVSLLLS
jgi:hypothetical protein